MYEPFLKRRILLLYIYKLLKDVIHNCIINMSSTSDTTTTGRVKWFNKSAGYGFITAMDGDHKGDDIFVHHSNLDVSKDQFRYLVEGEYINFSWSPSGNDNSKHEWQATSVSGICEGPLMCETHHDSRSEMSESSNASGGGASQRRGRRVGGGPSFTDSNGNEYKLVRNKSSRAREEAEVELSA